MEEINSVDEIVEDRLSYFLRPDGEMWPAIWHAARWRDLVISEYVHNQMYKTIDR